MNTAQVVEFNRYIKLLRALFGILILSIAQLTAFAQSDSNDVLIDPVVSLNKTIKMSTGEFENILPYPGKAYGITGDREDLLAEFEAKQKFELETGNYDSLLFFFSWLLSDNSQYEVNYFIDVLDNSEFIYEIIYEPGLSVDGDKVNTRKFSTYKGKKLFDVVLDDDVRPFRISVAPTAESSPFIDVVQSADTSRFQVRLKSSAEVDPYLKQNMQRFRSQGFAEIPVSVIISDPLIAEHNKPVRLYLRQKVKRIK